jgi:hypothetical protein
MSNYLKGQLGFSQFSQFTNSVIFFFFFCFNWEYLFIACLAFSVGKFDFLLSLVDGYAFETVYGCWENVGESYSSFLVILC